MESVYNNLMMKNDARAMGIVASYNPYSKFVSASRQAMVTSHLTQTAVPRESELPRFLHGFESQLADYAAGVKAPCDMRIIALIDKYPKKMETRVTDNPKTTVIYEDLDTGVIGCLDINRYECNHDTFGFRAKLTDAVAGLHVDGYVSKGEFFSHSNNVKDNGLYSQSLNYNVAYMSINETTEDGFVLSRSAVERAGLTAVDKREAGWGSDWIPLNLYGDAENYKPFPDIGDKVREDGLVFAIRRKDAMLDAINMTPAALMEARPTDRCTYGAPGAYVFDVDLISSETEGLGQTIPVAMREQTDFYVNSSVTYADRLLRVEQGLYKDYGSGLKLSFELQAKLRRAYAECPNKKDRNYGRIRSSGHISRLLKGDRLDEFRITLKYAREFPLHDSAKLTDLHGGKGVICDIWEDEDMPVDDFGNRVDVIGFGAAVAKRMNPGQLYEQYLNAACRDIEHDIRAMMDKKDMDGAWNMFLGMYDILAPDQAAAYRKLAKGKRADILKRVYEDKSYIVIRSDNDYINISTYHKMQAFRPPNKSPLTYRVDGKEIRTRLPILVGEKQMIWLEKSDSKPMAVSGARLQHHGLPMTATKANRYQQPGKVQAPRVYDESSVRAQAGTCGGEAAAHFHDMSTNPNTHEIVVKSILNADNPSQIERCVDRNEHPLGNSRPAAFFKHLLNCYGSNITNV